MKKLVLPVLLFCLSLPTAAPAEKFTAESKITAVTVYANRAAVTRTAKVKIPKGAHEVVFENLPAQLAGDSLRVEGSAVADVTLGALAHEQVVSKELTSAKERELTDALQLLQDKVELEKIEIFALNERLAALQKIGDTAPRVIYEDFAPQKFDPDVWAETSANVQNEISEVLRLRHGREMAMRILNEAVQKTSTELRSQKTGQKTSYKVTVPLESAGAGELTLALTYQVNNASWQPLYDARLDTEDGGLELVQYGAVKQLTGEDWEGVSLTLSTAQPNRGTSPPPFRTGWLEHEKNMTADAYRKAVEDTNVRRAEIAKQIGGAALPTPIGQVQGQLDMSRAAPQKKQARFVPAEIETGGLVAEYRIVGPATILSDNTESKLMVGGFDIESTLEVHIQPQKTTEAFLVARGKLKGETPVLPGAVSLFRDGAFIGKTRFPLLRPGERHDLSFGIDDRISVKRNTLKDESKEGGLIIKDSIIERHFVTELQNLRQRSVTVRLREIIPVSKSGDVKIAILPDKTTAGYKTDVDHMPGLTEWVFPLPAGEKKEALLGWRITWPKEQKLSGLPVN